VLTTPAVADYSNNPYGGPVPIFAAIGTDHQVWVTSIGSAPTWYPVGGYCLSSAAAAFTGTFPGGQDFLSIACEGSDGALWVELVGILPAGPADNPIPLQIVQGWTSFGGVLAAGPAIDTDFGAGAGPVYFAETPSHQVFYATQPNAWTPTSFYCVGHLAGGSFDSGGGSSNDVLGCQGTDSQMWFVTNNGAQGLGALPQGGTLIGGPGMGEVLNTPNTEAPLLFAEGTDHAAYDEWAESTPPQWSYLGGYIVGDGINASGL
jgi:hypothetical protein